MMKCCRLSTRTKPPKCGFECTLHKGLSVFYSTFPALHYSKLPTTSRPIEALGTSFSRCSEIEEFLSFLVQFIVFNSLFSFHVDYLQSSSGRSLFQLARRIGRGGLGE